MFTVFKSQNSKKGLCELRAAFYLTNIKMLVSK
jgi:hypothetical protein